MLVMQLGIYKASFFFLGRLGKSEKKNRCKVCNISALTLAACS